MGQVAKQNNLLAGQLSKCICTLCHTALRSPKEPVAFFQGEEQESLTYFANDL